MATNTPHKAAQILEEQGYTVVYPPTSGENDDPRIVAWLPVADIIVDRTTQRTTTDSRLDAMLAKTGGKFRWEIFEVITSTVRDNGDIVATEGQHRDLLARREKPGAYTWVIISEDANEAGVARGIAEGRLAHSPLARWNLRLIEGGLLERLAEETMIRHHLHLGNPGYDSIAAIGAVEAIMRTYGGRNASEEELREGADLLDSVLSLLTSVYEANTPANESRLDGNLLRVMGRLIGRNPQIRLDRLAGVVQAIPPASWVAKGKEKIGKQSNAEAMAVAMVAVYNRGPLADRNQIRW